MNALPIIGFSKTKQSKLMGVKLIFPLLLSSILMGCASGTPKTGAWKINEETIQAVKAQCTSTFSDASGGTISELWANKRAILAQARACGRAANTLANQAENRNKVIEGK